VFTRSIGLIAGLVNTCCYLVVTIAMALVAYLPEESQAPLGWLDVGAGVLFVALLLTTVRSGVIRTASTTRSDQPPTTHGQCEL